MKFKESIELARFFAQQLGGSTRQLCFAGLTLIWLLNKGKVGGLCAALWWSGALFFSALLADYFHSIVGAAWGGRIARSLVGEPDKDHDSSALFGTLYSFLAAKCLLVLAAYAFLFSVLPEKVALVANG